MTENRLPIPSLTPLVLLALRDQARTLGLNADRVSVEYVLNWGGFGSASYNVTDGGVHTTDEIVSAICRALGRPVPRWRVPTAVAFGAAMLFDEARRLTGRGAGTVRDRLQRYIENVAVDGSAIQRDLGFVPEYSLARGWQEVIAQLRLNGDLR